MRLINNMRLIAKCPRVYDIMIIAQAYFPLSGFCLLTICKQFINWMVGSSGNKAKALQWRILGSGCVRLNQSVLPHYKWHWKEVRRSHRGSICQALQQCFWSFYPHKTPEQRNSQITLCWPYLQVAHSSPFKTRITMLAYSSLIFKAASTDQMWYWYLFNRWIWLPAELLYSRCFYAVHLGQVQFGNQGQFTVNFTLTWPLDGHFTTTF